MGYDVVVIGLGAMGSAALYQLAKRGANVLGIDRFDPPHQLGSTHGESRVTRLAVGEGAAYVPLVRRTHAIWRELEAKTGEPMLFESGGYVLCPIGGGAAWHGVGDFAQASAQIAAANDIAHELLDATEVRRRHPLVQVEPHFHAYYEPTGGVVIPEAAVRVQLNLAREMGAVVCVNECVTAVHPHKTGVTLITDKTTVLADRAIVSTGAWIKQFMPQAVDASLGVYRQVMYWFEAAELRQFATDRFPFLLWIGETEDDYFAAFPVIAGRGNAVKLMTEQYVEQDDPDAVLRTVSPQEIETFAARFLPRKLRGVTPRCVDAKVCLYTTTPDEHFVIDWHPDSDRVLLVSPCSGHGFKHSAALGEALSELVLEGRCGFDLSTFSIKRFLK